MNLEKYIKNKLQQKPICLMTHVIAGYPSFDDNLQALEIMAENDVDLVEIQMPFTEPSADGPVFVHANQEALNRGANLTTYFQLMKKANSLFDFSILMMGYYNTVFKMGELTFLETLKYNGGSGFIIPDLPVEEGVNLYQKAKEMELSPVSLVAPTTSNERMAKIARAGSGFIYAVARAGVTGKHTKFDDEFNHYINRCKENIALPVAVGFGISDKSDIDYLTGKVEIAIIGTELLKAWENGGAESLRSFFKKLK